MLGFRSRPTSGLALFCTMVVFAAPEAQAQVKGKLVPVPKEEYGEQNGEKVLPGNGRAPNTVMRARAEDTFLKLSNPRLSTDAKRKTLLVDYEVTSRGKLDGGYLVLRTDDGGKAEVDLKSIASRDTGTVWRLHAVYSADQPQTHNGRSVARKGYAVAGAEVNMGKTVVGIRLLFQKVKPDGTFDSKDAYAGDWIGTAPKGACRRHWCTTAAGSSASTPSSRP